jgi:hypothetical protein
MFFILGYQNITTHTGQKNYPLADFLLAAVETEKVQRDRRKK